MPWTKKQNALFRAAEHNPTIAKKVGIKQSDAKKMAHEGVKKMAGGGAVQGDARKSDRYYGEDLGSKERGRIRDEAVGQREKAFKELTRSKDPQAILRPKSSSVDDFNQKSDAKEESRRKLKNWEAASENADDLPGRYTTGTKPYQYKKGGFVKKGLKEGSAAEEATESAAFEKKEDKPKKFSSGGSVRGVGCAVRGHGKGRMC